MKRLLTEKQVQKETGISVSLLRKWRYAVPPQGPAFARIGRCLRYPEDELERFISERTIQPINPARTRAK